MSIFASLRTLRPSSYLPDYLTLPRVAGVESKVTFTSPIWGYGTSSKLPACYVILLTPANGLLYQAPIYRLESIKCSGKAAKSHRWIKKKR